MQSENSDSRSPGYDFGEKVNSSNAHKVDGKSFFISKCATCHNAFKNGVGPALSGLSDRGGWNDSKKLYNYIRDPETVVKNFYLDSLRKLYGTKHIAFPDLSDEEIRAILRYVDVDYAKPVNNTTD